MSQNSMARVLFLCIWLLPVSSVQLKTFGIPIYPIEILLLAVFPFLPFSRICNREKESAVRYIVFFSLMLIGGTLLSYSANPRTLAGLGQIKSFFLFPCVLGCLAVVLFKDVSVRERALQHARWMFGISALGALIWGIYASGFTYDVRLRAWFDSPNLLALFLLPGALLWWMRVVGSSRVPWIEWCVWVGITCVLLLTRSYGACIAYGVAGLLFVWMLGRYTALQKTAWIFIACFLMGGIFFAGIEGGTQKWEGIIHGDERSSLASRIMIWDVAIRLIREHPVLGIGPSRFQSMYLEYQRFYPPYLEWAVPHPHNLLLAFWLSSGIFGALSYGCLIVLMITTIFFVRMNAEQALAITLLSAVCIAGLVDVPYFRIELSVWFWLVLALCARVCVQETTNPSSQRSIWKSF